MANEQLTVDPQQRFQEFFKREKYRRRIGQLAISGKNSMIIDFEELYGFDQALAEQLLNRPEDYLQYAGKGAYEQLRIEDAEYAEKIEKITIRIVGLLGKEQLRKLGSRQMAKLVMVEGIVVRATPVRPMVLQGAFKCKRCGTMNMVEQTGQFLKAPAICAAPDCGRDGPFEFVQEESTFIDSQDLRLQEKPEDLPPGQLPRTLAVKCVGDDIVDVARPGDHVSIVGIVHAFAPSLMGMGKLRTFILQLDANSVELLGKEPETSPPTPEEEEKIHALSKDPWVHRKIRDSIAPSIFGYEHIKEAIMYLLFGGVSKNLPDVNIRGEMNALLIGDPGCLVADERVVLGTGKIAKIGELGNEHLQPLSISVKTGQGGNHRAKATTFHVYRQQPIIEIVTESGKSLKGTYNQPVLRLVTDGEFGTKQIRREWTRLDELKNGDKVEVVKSYFFESKAYVPTGFVSFGLSQKKEINLPSKVTPSLAGLFGYIIGDGGVDSYRITLYVVETEEDLIPKLIEMIDRNFGVAPEAYERKAENRNLKMHILVLHSVDAAHNISFLGEKRVPKLIFESPNDCVIEFLRWLFEADGTVFNKGRGRRAVGLKAKDIELLRDVQLLLLRFGIHSRILGIDSANPALLIRRGRDIIRFKEKIGFASAKKTKKLEGLAQEAQSFKRSHQKQFERIIKIVKHPLQDVFDIEVPESQRFIANGIIVHNTAKSQLLQYVARIAPRGLYTSGRGTTAAGLTAAVVREKGGSMSLEAGALVLADKGIACVTEDTEIYTGEGLVKIGKLWEDTPSPILETKTGREAKKLCLPVSIYDARKRVDLQGSAFMIMRKRHVGEVIKLTLASGLSLKVTPEHLLKRPTNVKNLWVRADEVKVGDDLRAPVCVFGPAVSLKMTPDEAYVIGCVYGDGWFGDSSITISQSKVNEDVVQEIAKRTPSTFSVYDKGDRDRQLGKYMLVSRMFQLYTAKKDFVLQARLLLRSPSIDKVLMLDDQALWAFFAGVFDTDGDVNHNNDSVIAARLYPTKNEHELSLLLYALRRLGIYARIHGKHSTIPVIQITGADISKFITGICSYSVKVRRQTPQQVIIKHKGKRSLKRGLERVVLVEKVLYDGYVYDLSVGKYHNYEAGLVYVHNCIDEMDKMRPEDRVAIHEAMEQHTVSVAKGGIVATLNARTAVLAAANPSLGRYEPNRTVAENVPLPVTILSRFDLIFVLRDVPNKEADGKMSKHILEIHRRGASPVESQVDSELLRKYVSYAKGVKPVLTDEALKQLSDFYLAMRSASETEGSPVAITARQLESLVRLAEARARVALRKEVSAEDAGAAIAIMKKSLEEVGIDLSSYKMDIDLIMTGRPKSIRDRLSIVLSTLMNMEKATGMVEKEALVNELETKSKIPRAEAERMISQMLREGTIYEPREGCLKKT